MIIEHKEILGYKIGDEIVCAECLAAEENVEITADDVLRKGEDDTKNTSGFCDRCKKRLW